MKKNINFFAFYKVFIGISLALSLAAVILSTTVGFRYSADFKGGVESFVVFEEDISQEMLVESLKELGIESEVQKVLSQEKTFIIRVLPDAVNEAFIKKYIQNTNKPLLELPMPNSTSSISDASKAGLSASEEFEVAAKDEGGGEAAAITSDVSNPTGGVVSLATDQGALVRKSLFAALSILYNKAEFSILQTRIIGSVLSSENRRNSYLTSLLVIVLIVGYLSMRFQFPFALAAITAVIHDVLIMLLCVVVFDVEFSILTMVAILTTFGYSVNDTIILLDRVREEQKKLIFTDFKKLLNLAINKVVTRSLITSLTTITVVVALYVSTTGVYKDFAFILVIGLISGTYSSLYVATALLLLWNKKRPFLKLEK